MTLDQMPRLSEIVLINAVSDLKFMVFIFVVAYGLDQMLFRRPK